jgi:hypothetical protein
MVRPDPLETEVRRVRRMARPGLSAREAHPDPFRDLGRDQHQDLRLVRGLRPDP